jgi:putative effector of murein hydrolase LrgA (UPF0299 family)
MKKLTEYMALMIIPVDIAFSGGGDTDMVADGFWLWVSTVPGTLCALAVWFVVLGFSIRAHRNRMLSEG